MSEFNLEVTRRESIGKNHNRRLRAAGGIPAVVYGAGLDNLTIRVDDRQMQAHLRSGGANSLFRLRLKDTEEERHVMIRDLQVDPLTGSLVHIDFYRVMMDETVRVTVPIELVGTPIGVTRDGGLVEFVTREIEIECLPTVIPSNLPIEIGQLEIGQHLEVGDVELAEGLELSDEPTRVIVSVSVKRVEEEEETEEEEESAEAAVAEGDEPEEEGS